MSTPSTGLPDPIDESSPRYHGWRVVGACFVMAALVWGFGFYGHGFYLAELQRRHGWPATLMGGASTFYYLVSALLVVFISDAIRRFGVRACVLTGALALASSVAVLPFVAEPWQVVVAYLVMSLGWATMSLGAINTILGLWFERKRGLAISLALNGASFGGVVIVPSLVFLSGATSFAYAMLAGAAVILALMLPLCFAVLGASVPRPSAQADSIQQDKNRVDVEPHGGWTRASALRSLAFWNVSSAFALAITSQAGFLVHQIAFLETAIGRYAAGVAVAITTSMAILGRLTLGIFAQRINQRVAAALSLVSQAAALGAMTQTQDAAILLGACAVYGFSVGNVITFPSLIVQREFPAAAFGMLIGLATGISQFTYAFGPGLIGLVRDATGGYGASLALCMTLNFIAATILLRRPGPGRGVKTIRSSPPAGRRSARCPCALRKAAR
jgi:MFS family permease